MQIKRYIIVGLVSASVLGASGCATWQNSAQAKLDDARKLVELSKSTGAEKFAPETVRTASDYLDKANALLAAGNVAGAEDNIGRAVAAAQLAKAESESGETVASIDKLKAQIASLADL